MKSTACKVVISFLIAIVTQNISSADVLLAHLQKEGDEITLQHLRRSEGEIKPANQTQGEQFEYRCLDAAGSVIAQGRFDFIPAHFHNGPVQQNLHGAAESVLLQIPWDERFAAFECYHLEKRVITSPIDLSLRAALTVQPRQDQPQAVKILDNGPDEKRLVWVLVGEGYTAAEQDKYRSDVEEAVQRFLTYEPWSAYKNLINVYYIHNAISNTSGIGLTSPRDTLFGLYYYYGVEGRLIWSPSANPKIAQFIARYAPGGFDLGLVICNDATAIGGSGGQFPTFNLDYFSTEIAVHETGHSFAFLADEYVDLNSAPYYFYDSAFPNVMEMEATQLPSLKREQVRWDDWIESDITFPGVGSNGIGLVEGAFYHPTGYYRPKEDCLMRGYGVPFCEICMEAHVVRLYDYISPLNSVQPTQTTLQSSDPEPDLFYVDLNQNKKRSVAAHWFINGQAVGEGGALVFDPEPYNHQTVEIKVVVRDETDWVRQDPFLDNSHNPNTNQGVHKAASNRIQVEHKWTVQVNFEPVAVPDWALY